MVANAVLRNQAFRVLVLFVVPRDTGVTPYESGRSNTLIVANDRVVAIPLYVFFGGLAHPVHLPAGAGHFARCHSTGDCIER